MCICGYDGFISAHLGAGHVLVRERWEQNLLGIQDLADAGSQVDIPGGPSLASHLALQAFRKLLRWSLPPAVLEQRYAVAVGTSVTRQPWRLVVNIGKLRSLGESFAVCRDVSGPDKRGSPLRTSRSIEKLSRDTKNPHPKHRGFGSRDPGSGPEQHASAD